VGGDARVGGKGREDAGRGGRCAELEAPEEREGLWEVGEEMVTEGLERVGVMVT